MTPSPVLQNLIDTYLEARRQQWLAEGEAIQNPSLEEALAAIDLAIERTAARSTAAVAVADQLVEEVAFVEA